MASIEGVYRLQTYNNYSKLLKELGAGSMKRILAETKYPVAAIKAQDDGYQIFVSGFNDSQITFKLEEEFEEKGLDGKPAKTVIKEENGSLIQTQNGENQVTMTRTFTPDGMKILYECNSIIADQFWGRIS